MPEVVFAGIDAMEHFARFTERLAAESIKPFVAGAELISHKLYENTTKVFGDVSKLRALEQSTQDSRVERGYSANEPLLEDGSLLRDSVERFHELTTAAVGSDEPVMHYMEYGFHNVRAGRFVEPRPAFEIGLAETLPEAEEITNMAVESAFGFGPFVALKP